MTSKILISACLLGHKVKYDGKCNNLYHKRLIELEQKGLLIPVCPEMAGGLPTPRPPCEIVSQNPIKITTKDNIDYTNNFVSGARQALAIVKKHNIKVAILKESSPSCGSNTIYSGKFNKTKITGQGVTATALMQVGVKVYNEHQIDEAVARLL